MTNEEARQILAFYRPGTADRIDPSFDEALERAKPHPPEGQDKHDPNLGRWFQEHCSSYLSIRNKFVEIPVPAGLQERILAEIQGPSRKIIPFRPSILLYAAAVLAVCLSLAALYWRSHGSADDFNSYRSRMVRTALQPYGMVRSHDLRTINLFLAGQKAPTDYILPPGVLKAQPVGCAVVKWLGQPVSLICFRSGQSLSTGDQPDLWLFVVNQSSVPAAPAAEPPVIAQVNLLTTAAWSQNGKTYVLAGAGDAEFLRKYF